MAYVYKTTRNQWAGAVTDFTPETLTAAARQALNGNWVQIHRIWTYCLMDPYVSGCMMGRYAGLQKDFTIETDNDQRRELIETVLKKINWRRFVRAIIDARFKKFQVLDFDWDVEAGYQVPLGFRVVPHELFSYHEDGSLRYIERGSEREIPAEVLLVEQDKEQFPVMLPVLSAWIYLRFGRRAWAAFLETFGEPFIIGYYPPGAEDDIIAQVEAGVEALGQSARGTMPDNGVQKAIELIESGKNTGDHREFTLDRKKEISIAVLGHANAVEESEGMKVGSNETPYKVARTVNLDDLDFVDDYLETFVAMIINRNFPGEDIKLTIDKTEPVDVKEFLDVVDTAQRHKVPILRSNYEKLGLDLPDDWEMAEPEPKQPWEFE